MKKKFYGYKAAVAMGIYCFFVSGGVGLYAYLMPSAMVRLNCSAAQLTAITAVMGIVSFLSSFIAGKAYSKFGAEKCQLAYGVTGALFVIGFIFAKDVWILFVLAAIMGLFAGMGGTAAISAYVADWFIDKRQEISGYVTSTCTFGGFAAGMLFSFLASSMAAEKAAVLLLIVFGVICVVSAFFMRSRTKMGQLPLGYKAETEADAADVNAAAIELPGTDLKETIKSASLWFLCAGIFVSCLGIYYLSCGTLIMTGAGMEIAAVSRTFAMVTMSMGIGSIVVGNLFAKLGCKKALVVVYGLMLLSLGGLAYWCGNPGSVVLITIISIVFGFADSGLVLLPVMSYSELFGMKSFGRMMPIMVAVSVVAASCCGTLMSSVYDACGNWVTPTLYSIGLIAAGALCVVLAFVFSPMKKKAS